MSVNDLITRLQQLPGTAEVLVEGQDYQTNGLVECSVEFHDFDGPGSSQFVVIAEDVTN